MLRSLVGSEMCIRDRRADGIARATEALGARGLVVMPTDTVYGVAADAFSPQAVATLLAAKGRGRHMPPPVLIPRPETLQGLATDIPEAVSYTHLTLPTKA